VACARRLWDFKDFWAVKDDLNYRGQKDTKTKTLKKEKGARSIERKSDKRAKGGGRGCMRRKKVETIYIRARPMPRKNNTLEVSKGKHRW